MKKKNILVILIGLISISNTYSQITLEYSYPDSGGLSIMKLENSGYKYLQYDITTQVVKLYNLDHSIFKTIVIPNFQPTTVTAQISYITENLFNLDNLIEVCCAKEHWNPYNFTWHGAVQIINELGTVVFTQDSMIVVEQRDATYYGYANESSFVFNTTSGTKMILYSYKSDDIGFKVFSLPGVLTASIPPVQNGGDFGKLIPFPNPSNSQITIPYDLPKGTTAILTVYDTKGSEVRKLKIDNTFQNVFIDISKLENGLYLYSINNESQLISTGEFIVSK